MACLIGVEYDVLSMIGMTLILIPFSNFECFSTFYQDTSGSVGLKPLAKLPALSKLLIELEKESLLDLFWLKQLEPRATKSSIYKSSIAVIVFNAIVANIKDVTKIPKVKRSIQACLLK